MVSEYKIGKIPIIHFGAGKIKMLPGLFNHFIGQALIVVSKSLDSISSQIREFESDLNKSSLNFEFVYTHGEPTANSVDEIVNSIRNQNITVVCAIGGGSAIDTGKAISAMITETGSIEAYIE